MTTPASTAEAGQQSGERDKPRRPLLRHSRNRVPSAVWYVAAAFGIVLLVVLVQLLLYARRHEPRDAGAIVERELAMNTLRPGERVLRELPVYRRSGVDYFRQTRGLLVLTDRRLIYLGIPPRDPTGVSDAPPAFDLREFRIDTLVSIEPSFAVLGLSRALTIETSGRDLELGIATGGREKAQLLRQAWDARHRQLRAIGASAAKVRAARTELGRVLAEYRAQPVYHLVQPGDAVSSIASWYEVSADSIAALNGIVDNRIRVGQKLLIRRGR